MVTSCINCANVMKLEDPKVPLRCGADYFGQPAILRHAARLDHYPPVDADGGCVMWVGHESRHVSIPRDSQLRD